MVPEGGSGVCNVAVGICCEYLRGDDSRGDAEEDYQQQCERQQCPRRASVGSRRVCFRGGGIEIRHATKVTGNQPWIDVFPADSGV